MRFFKLQLFYTWITSLFLSLINYVKLDNIKSRDDKYCEEEYSDLVRINRKWKNGIIPYVFVNIEPELKGYVLEAMERIMNESSILFMERTNHDEDYIEINDTEEFKSSVGRMGGKQSLHVSGDECEWPNLIGNIMHELMHVLGFYHEHSRPDRDEHMIVTIIGHNYDKITRPDVFHFGPFDPDSITLYSKKEGFKPRINAKIGQREKLSDGDIYALNLLYPPEIIFSQFFQSKTFQSFIKSDQELERYAQQIMERIMKVRAQELERLKELKLEILQESEGICRNYPKLEKYQNALKKNISQEFEKMCKKIIQCIVKRIKEDLKRLKEIKNQISTNNADMNNRYILDSICKECTKMHEQYETDRRTRESEILGEMKGNILGNFTKNVESTIHYNPLICRKKLIEMKDKISAMLTLKFDSMCKI